MSKRSDAADAEQAQADTHEVLLLTTARALRAHMDRHGDLKLLSENRTALDVALKPFDNKESTTNG